MCSRDRYVRSNMPLPDDQASRVRGADDAQADHVLLGALRRNTPTLKGWLAACERQTARPAPRLPPAPRPTWQRSGPSDHCNFEYHAGRCVLPTAWVIEKHSLATVASERQEGLAPRLSPARSSA